MRKLKIFEHISLDGVIQLSTRLIAAISSAVTEGTSRPATVMNYGAGLTVGLFVSSSPYQPAQRLWPKDK